MKLFSMAWKAFALIVLAASICIPASAQTVSSQPQVITLTGTNTVTLSASSVARRLIFADINYTASATVGNRYIVMQLLNASNTVVGDLNTSAAITASATDHIDFVPGTYRETAFDATKTIQTPFPVDLLIPANYTLKIVDVSNVSTGDAETAYLELRQ